MSLKSLILLREGKSDASGRLSVEGMVAIRSAIEALRLIGIWNAGRFKIFSSPDSRCRECAITLANEFGVGVDTTPTLAHQNGCDDFRPLLQLINRQIDKAETIVLVTHREICHRFPAYFLYKTLDRRPPIILELGYGDGIVIDVTSGAVSRLTQP